MKSTAQSRKTNMRYSAYSPAKTVPFKLNMISVVTLAILSNQAIAQESNEVTDEETSAIEVIQVTADKRVESIQDVGFSLQAFGEDALAKGGIQDVSRIDLLVSGVNFAFVGNDAKFNVRGANSSNTFADNSSIVGAFVDGVYKTRASQQSRAFFDVQRVEFLKGPQGTLYGRNTFAGALNLYTNTPDTLDYSAGIETSFERFNRTQTEAFVNIPISETFAVRVAGFIDKGDGYIENLAGEDLGQPDDRGFRISALWEASDTTEVLFRYSNIRESGVEAGLFGYTFLCRNVTPEGLTDPFGTEQDCENPQPGSAGTPSAEELGPFTVEQDFTPPIDLSEDVFSLEVNSSFGNVDFKSITSYTDYVNNIGFDFDFSGNPFQRGFFDESVESFTQEITFSSNYDSRLQWTAGAYYSEDETFFSFSIFNQTVADNSGRPSVVGPNGDIFTVLQGTPLASLDTVIGGFFADSTFIDIDTLGLYTQAEYSISDELRIIAGLRYNREEKRLFGAGNNFTAGDAPVTVTITDVNPRIIPSSPAEVFAINPNAADAISAEETFNNVSWRLGLEYDVADDILVYFNAATGFLSGALGGNGTITDEQDSQVLELGLKSILLDDTLQLNVAAHYTEYTNLLTQIQVPQPGGLVQTFSENGGEIDAKGIEVEAVYVPIDAVRLTLNASLLDSEFGTFGQINPYQLFNGQVQDFINVEGETTAWSPDYTLTFAASYEFDLGDSGFITPYIQFFASDGYNTGNILAIDPNHQQGSFTKTDIRLVWNSADYDYSVEAFIENIEDEAVLARGNNNGNDLVQTGFLYPRNAGVRFKARF